MKCIFFILPSIFLAACASVNKEQVFVDVMIDISVKDGDGNDLLNSNFANSLNQDEFKIFYEVKGEQVEYYEKHLDRPKGFSVYKHEEEYRISVMPNTDKNVPYPMMYIKWSEMDTDTLKCDFDRNGGSEVCTKVWFNNELVWKSGKTERFFEIKK